MTYVLSLFIYLRFVPSNVVDRNWSRKKWAFWQKLAKKTVSNPNWFHFFIFVSHSFTWKLTNKNDSFVTIFWKKCWNFGQVSWNCDIGITFAAAASFKFFRPNWQFQNVSQITVSWNCPKVSTFFQKRSQKLSFLSSVSRETGEKKKETSFQLKPLWNHLGFTKY